MTHRPAARVCSTARRPATFFFARLGTQPSGAALCQQASGVGGWVGGWVGGLATHYAVEICTMDMSSKREGWCYSVTLPHMHSRQILL